MSRRCREILILLACSVSCMAPLAASEPTSKTAEQALRRGKFPWYDESKDAFRALRDEQEMTLPDWKWSSFWTNAVASLSQIILWGLLAAFLAIILIVIIRNLPSVEIDSGEQQPSDAATIDLEKLDALPEPAKGIKDLLGEAARLASQSQFGPAMTFYYSWQLVQLDQHQSIEIQKGKTNRQYAREVKSSRPELIDTFLLSIRLFEDAFFGDLPVSREDFLRVWEQKARFSAVPRKGRP